MSKFILLVLGWIVYFFLHSLLADTRVKKYFEIHSTWIFRSYRIFYNIISAIGLLMLLVLNGSIPSSHLLNSGTITRYLSLMLATAGILVIKASFKQYKLSGFLGLRQDGDEKFQTNGILKHIRHPLYSGTILIVAGFWLFSPNVTTLISAGCIFAYLPIGIMLEERKLIEHYGEAYREYRKKVPALIPKIKFG